MEQLRLGFTALLLLCGAFLLGLLVVPQYDRALVLSGRTEMLSERLAGSAFGVITFPYATYRPDLDAPAQQGSLELDIQENTIITFKRLGRREAHLKFDADVSAPSDPACGAIGHRIGRATLDGVGETLCEGANVVVSLTTGEDPIVIALSGDIVVGEGPSQGAGPRPLLLEATALLMVKHGGWFFRTACFKRLLESLCDRFVANSAVLSPGDSVSVVDYVPAADPSAGMGFIRIDPDDLRSGMLFSLSATASAFNVQRLQADTFTVRESLFDVIEKSPVVRTLNTILVALGLVWYFLRLVRGGSGEGGGAVVVLAGALLCAPGAARAQQAMLRADETGQALLRSCGDRCYAVTPLHVLGAETSALVTAPGRERGEGDLLHRR